MHYRGSRIGNFSRYFKIVRNRGKNIITRYRVKGGSKGGGIAPPLGQRKGKRRERKEERKKERKKERKIV